MALKKKILIADDSKTALMMATMAVKSLPCEVMTAADGEEAVAKALADPPDVIVLDVMMPKLDGFEACRRLRSADATKRVPILMLTTRGESQNREVGFTSGCTEYLTKPLNMADFVGRLKTHLGE